MSNSNCLSKMESVGIILYDKLFESRIIIGVLVLLSVTAISVAFNTYTGHWMATDEASEKLLPFSYAMIAFSGVVILAITCFGNANWLIKSIGLLALILIFTLDIFASLTFQIATDSKNELQGDALEVEQLKLNIASAQDRVDMWSEKLKATKKYHIPWDKKLKEATAMRDKYQRQLNDLQSEHTDPILSVFDKLYNFVPYTVDDEKVVSQDEFKTLIRSAWSFMLASLPYVMTLMIFGEIAGMNKRSLNKKKPLAADRFTDQDHSAANEQLSGPDQTGLNREESFGPTESDTSNVVLFEERRPDQSAQTRPAQRKTGLDRAVSQKIMNYLAQGDGSIATGYVAKKFGVGKELLGLVYDQARLKGFIDQPNGKGSRWVRNNLSLTR